MENLYVLRKISCDIAEFWNIQLFQYNLGRNQYKDDAHYHKSNIYFLQQAVVRLQEKVS